MLDIHDFFAARTGQDYMCIDTFTYSACAELEAYIPVIKTRLEKNGCQTVHLESN